MNEDKKGKLLIWFCILAFGAAGIYLTFFSSDTSKYDSNTKASRIDVRERYDSDGTMYTPVYYFYVNGQEYSCESKGSGSSYPNESKNTVYYESSNPTKCLTEYDASGGKLFGIIALVVTGIILFFFVIKKPQQLDQSYLTNDIDESNINIDSEKAEKVLNVVNKVSLIYKRVILVIIIIILLVLTLIDAQLFKQTIKAKNYPEAVAQYVGPVEKQEENNIFDDYIYTYQDKNGTSHEITITNLNEGGPEQEITIKYNESDPTEFYSNTSFLDKSGMIWFIVKIVAIILLIVLFFSKNLLNKIGISMSNARN